jgi:hypothetical protein
MSLPEPRGPAPNCPKVIYFAGEASRRTPSTPDHRQTSRVPHPLRLHRKRVSYRAKRDRLCLTPPTPSESRKLLRPRMRLVIDLLHLSHRQQVGCPILYGFIVRGGLLSEARPSFPNPTTPSTPKKFTSPEDASRHTPYAPDPPSTSRVAHPLRLHRKGWVIERSETFFP